MADFLNMTDEALAEVFARRLARRRGQPDWRTLLTPCWQGVAGARAAGSTALAVLYRAAACRCTDHLRAETGWRRKSRAAHVQFAAEWEDAAVPAPEAAADPAARLLRVWCEEAGLRAGLRPRVRVLGYLYYVEGWTQAEIAACLGLDHRRVWRLVADFTEGVARARAGLSGVGAAGRPGQVGGARGGDGGAAEGVGHAGDAGPGDPPGATVGGRRPGPDPDGAVAGGGPLLRAAGRGRGVDGHPGPAAHLPGGAGAGRVRRAGEAGGPDDGGPPAGPLSPHGEAPGGGRRVYGTPRAVRPPAGVRTKAAVLRAAMLDGVGADDVQAVVGMLMDKAKGGDVAAAKVFLGLLGGGK